MSIGAYESGLGNPFLTNNLELEFRKTCNRWARQFEISSSRNDHVMSKIELYIGWVNQSLESQRFFNLIMVASGSEIYF